MADGQGNIQDTMTEDEWKTRVDLAALYRLTALYGWTDLVFTHISARIPNTDHHFLINPYGYLFEEITASSLVKIDLEGNILQETDNIVNPAGFVIHSAIHEARDDANFVMHLHTDDGVAVSCQKEGLMPLGQTSLIVRPQLAYHEYEGIALEDDEKSRLVADLGDKNTMLLWNHGTLAIGRSAGECFNRMYFLERACSAQIKALSAGRDNVKLAPEASHGVVEEQSSNKDMFQLLTDFLVWPALQRKLNRDSPGYDS